MTATETPQFLKRLKTQLRKDLEATEVDLERVAGVSKYRVAVVSPLFTRMSHLKRQDRIWQIVDQILKPSEVLKISLILAFAPNELGRGRRTKKAS